MNAKTRILSVIAAVVLPATALVAQDFQPKKPEKPAATPTPTPAPKPTAPPVLEAKPTSVVPIPIPVAVEWQPRVATFSDPQFKALAGMLEGSWKTTQAVATGGTGVHVVASFAPVLMSGVPDAMYGEIARADAMEAPYRQVILQFHRENGKVRLKTYEFRRPNGEVLSLRTLWLTPEHFPAELTEQDLIPTTDVEFTAAGATQHGVTVQGYKSTVGGAAEVTSEIELSPTGLRMADRGVGADGSIVWGPAKGEWTAFERFSTGINVRRLEGGLTVVDYPSTVLSDRAPGKNNRVSVHYIGTLGNGTIFDASYTRGTPYRYSFDERLLEGWNQTMGDIRVGMKRKLILPAKFAWREQGNPSKNIGPNATLYFQLEVLEVTPVEPSAPLPPVVITPDDIPPGGKPVSPEIKQPPVKVPGSEEKPHNHPH